jgi:primary-amine oxidase
VLIDAQSTTGPLDPLSVAEMEQVVALVRAHPRFHGAMRFSIVALVEPTKGRLRSPSRPDREAEVVVLDGREETAFRFRVNLATGAISEWERLDGIQPRLVDDEYVEVETISRRDERVREALRRRGLDLDRHEVQIDPWSAGNFGRPEEHGQRIARGLFFLRHEPDDNAYAHPIDGLSTVVDLHRQEVVAVEDDAVLPIPQEPGNYAASYQETWRDDLKPLEIVQPEGPSFRVDGWRVTWQNWSLRVSFNPREGLVLHQVEYDDHGDVRPIMHRASVAELTVPYGDASFIQRRKNAFDVGEYGLGVLTNSLELGCDCLGEIHYFDVAYVNPQGAIVHKPNAICLHEEDDGLLWKHHDMRTGKTDVRRSRKLVISFIATVGNYEYAFYWSLHQDGTIELEVKATGIVQTGYVAPGEQPKHGTRLGPDLYAPHHQHFFCARMDMTVDGERNQVTEVDTVADPTGDDNPYGNAFYLQRRTFETETEAQRDIDLDRARFWLIESSERRNAHGTPTAFKLAPGDNCRPFARPDSAIAQRAGYMWHHLWVTPWAEDERHPAGEFPNQHPGGDGLPSWTEAGRSVRDTDIVVWYVMGQHHIVRPEDWPVMPVSRCSFALRPAGFFDRNPTLDVPPSGHGMSRCCGVKPAP